MLGKDKVSLKELFGSRFQTGRQKIIMIMAGRAGLEVIVHVYKGIEVYGDSCIVRVFFRLDLETRHENARSAGCGGVGIKERSEIPPSRPRGFA